MLTIMPAVGALLISAPLTSLRRTPPGALLKSCDMTMSDAETAAIANVASITSSLTRFGLDSGDKQKWDRLASAVAALENAMPTEPPIATDTRLVGDWELIGCTSYELVSKKGLTGLGAAPFTNLGALHCSFTAAGKVTAKETLEFFGKPVILNELRGSISFSDDGDSMQVVNAPRLLTG